MHLLYLNYDTKFLRHVNFANFAMQKYREIKVTRTISGRIYTRDWVSV